MRVRCDIEIHIVIDGWRVRIDSRERRFGVEVSMDCTLRLIELLTLMEP